MILRVRLGPVHDSGLGPWNLDPGLGFWTPDSGILEFRADRQGQRELRISILPSENRLDSRRYTVVLDMPWPTVVSGSKRQVMAR